MAKVHFLTFVEFQKVQILDISYMSALKLLAAG